MILDQRTIQIKSSPEKIFSLIEKMPNKFPVHSILETKPFFFLRILFVDGFRAALKAIHLEMPDDELILNVGDALGPFQLTEFERPTTYRFTLRSFFFTCRTGYSLYGKNNVTTLHFDLIAEHPGFMEKLYWYFIKPFHVLLANKSLKIIKSKVSSR